MVESYSTRSPFSPETITLIYNMHITSINFVIKMFIMLGVCFRLLVQAPQTTLLIHDHERLGANFSNVLLDNIYFLRRCAALKEPSRTRAGCTIIFLDDRTSRPGRPSHGAVVKK